MDRWRTRCRQFPLAFSAICHYCHITTPCSSPTSLSRGDIITYPKWVQISQTCGSRSFVRRMYLVSFLFILKFFVVKYLLFFRSLAASLYPNLFHSLVLVDPAIYQPFNFNETKSQMSVKVQGALNRRGTWSSKQVYFLFFSRFFYQNFFLVLKNPFRIDKKLSIYFSKILSSKPGTQPFSRSTSNAVYI